MQKLSLGHRIVQLSSPSELPRVMGIGKGEWLRNIVVLPEHSRDEKHLLDAAYLLEKDSNFRAIIVKRRAVSMLAASFRNARQNQNSHLLYWEWPSTNHGTNLDGGVGLEAQTLRRQLRRRFGRIDCVFVSDIIGDQPALAIEFQRVDRTRVVLVPEGLSVLANEASSRWVERNWKSAAGLIFRDTLLELADFISAKFWKSRQRRWRRKFRVGWRLRRVIRLLVSRPHNPSHWRLANVEAVVSDWPGFVQIPVKYQKLLIKPSAQVGVSEKGPRQPRAMVVIGQPLDISTSTWSLGLRKMKSEASQIDRVVLRPHPDREYEEQLVNAIRDVFPDAYHEIDELKSEVESLLVSQNFGYICAVSSTVLFDELVWRRTDSNLVCLYDALHESATPAERSLLEKQSPAVESIRNYSHLRQVALLEGKMNDKI